MISSPDKTVSVILPNYNYAKYLSSRVDEITNQTYPISEIIFLDDASTDDSIEIIKKEAAEIKKNKPDIKIKIIVNKENSGNVFSQWQKGIKHATGKYIWIAELDDTAKSSFLETAIKGFEEENTVLSYTDSKYIDGNDKPILKDNLRKIKDAFRRNILVYNTIPNVSAAIFKNQPCLINYLEEAKNYQLSGDWFFYIKLFETGKIVFSRKALNLHRLHAGSVTKNTNLKKRFSEMKSIHEYIFRHNLADKKTQKAIKKIEEELKKKWEI